MGVPRTYELYAPVFRALMDGDEHSFDKISVDDAEDMQLGADSLTALLPGKRNTVFEHRLSEALKDLVKKGGFIEEVSPKHYQLTEEGKQYVVEHKAMDSLGIRVEILMNENARLGGEDSRDY